jgi:hypothetical protein
MCGGHVAAHHPRAHAEELLSQSPVLRRFQAQLKSRLIPGRSLSTSGSSQGSVPAQQIKQFAGHVGAQRHHAPRLQLHPFAMGSGQHKPAVAMAQQRRAEQLGFFTAHHIGLAVRVAQAVAGNDERGRLARSAGHGVQVGGQVLQGDSLIEIRHRHPAQRTADHTGKHHHGRANLQLL